MAKSAPSTKATPLTQEHGYLGAELEPDANGVLTPSYYGDAAGEPEAFAAGCALADMSGTVGSVVEGADAGAFLQMAFAGPLPVPGQLVESVALRGDGTVVSPALVACLGDYYGLWAPAETAQQLTGWLEGVAAIEQAGSRAFSDVKLGHAAAMVTLLVAGPDSERVLSDYLAPDASLPAVGSIANLMLDRIPTVCGRVDVNGAPWTLLWVPETKARVLWRSLLSFEQVTPVGSSAVWGQIEEQAPGLGALLDDPDSAPLPQECGAAGLLRADGGFIGARALAELHS